METRAFGTTGLFVSPLGLGTGSIGTHEVSDARAESILRTAAELGVCLVDSARSYGLAEERIGRFMTPALRDAIVVSTKVGYGVEGVPDWTPECIARGVDDARRRMRVDVLDVVHLHSCPQETLERSGVVDALERAREAGKLRVAAYSGENEALDWAIDSGRFGAIQASVNVCDQRSTRGAIVRARARGMGVLGKRALANHAFGYRERPVGSYAEAYWTRWQAMALEVEMPAEELFLRFAAFSTDACLVGTSDEAHLRADVALIERGPLPPETLAKVRRAFDAVGGEWRGEV